MLERKDWEVLFYLLFFNYMTSISKLSSINLKIDNKFYFIKSLEKYSNQKQLKQTFLKPEFFFYKTKPNKLISYAIINTKLYILYNTMTKHKLALTNNFFKLNTYLKLEELELKGINFRFSKLTSTLLLDLGSSHFQVLTYPFFSFFLALKKKKLKKILFINFNKSYFFSTVKFFRFKLKAVGPYKLKGFQFINEKISLKEGKKPFK